MEEIKPIETVTIEKSVLEKLQKQIEEQQKSIARLDYAADKGRIARWESSHAGEKEKKVSLHGKTVDGVFKIITAWRVIEDIRQLDPKTNTQVGERQVIEVIYQDGTKQEIIGYGTFTNLLYSEELTVKVLSESKDIDGSSLKVGLPSGEELIINSKYVN